jgi:DNA polymerase I-like protein with 3'-5' exonuclease and polymerase domains
MTIRTRLGLAEEPDFKNNEKFQRLAFDFFPRLSRALGKMEFAGARVNQDVARVIDVRTRKEMADIRETVNKVPQVRAFVADRLAKEKAKRKTEKGKNKVSFDFNPGSDDQVRSLLYDYYKLRPVELTEAGEERFIERQKKWNEGRKATKKMLWKDVVDDAIKNREWNFFSVKSDVMHEHDRQGNELAKLLLKYRDAETLNGTFVQALLTKLDPDMNIHGSFNIPGTQTGRLASTDPNLQNIPNKDGGSIKKGYVSKFGDEGVLVQIDYSQIELRVAASYFNEPTMIDAYVRGDDLHTLTAIALSKHSSEDYKQLDDKIKKGWRNRAKRVNFGVLYGGGAPALQSTLKKDGVFLTLEECQKLIDVYFESRPALRRGIDKLMEQVKKRGYLESFTGRRRRVPEVFSDNNELVARALRQSVNFPIQSGASDMTLMSLCLIAEEMERRGLRSHVILTVHDSIVFDCHVDEFMEVSLLAKEIMENIDKLSDQILPGLDWSWLKCPIVAELDVGANWGSTVAFEPKIIIAGESDGSPLWTTDKDGKMKNRDPHNMDELWEVLCKKAV